MKLSTLVSALQNPRVFGNSDVDAFGVASDSRLVNPGDVFVCIRGFRADGHSHVEEALSRGAIAVVSEQMQSDLGALPQIVVSDTRLALARLAARFYGEPSKEFDLVGVTGTTGKTTTTYLVESVCRAAGGKTGLIGTVDILVNGEKFPVQLTTPESIDLQRIFRKMAGKGVRRVAMEVSSHAVDLQRVDSCYFDVLVFTNLSQDHLDYHNSMPEYFKVKSRLFERNPGAAWVVNRDDGYGRRIMEMAGERVVSYGLTDEADVRAETVDIGREGLQFRLVWAHGSAVIESRLKGQFNLYNLLAAAGAGIALGLDGACIKQGLEAVAQIPGRFETVDVGQEFDVVVDFAHTPDSLEKVLKSARQITTGRIITVFGCGGDRDRIKRPIMGQIAGELSDVTVLTSDNPRSEEPMAIIDEIEAGLKSARPKKYAKIPDRREAILEAVSEAKPGDLVLIAGKGHENYQIFQRRTIAFDDRKVAKEAVKSLVKPK